MSSLARPCPPGPPPVAFPSNLRCGFVAEHLSIINHDLDIIKIALSFLLVLLFYQPARTPKLIVMNKLELASDHSPSSFRHWKGSFKHIGTLGSLLPSSPSSPAPYCFTNWKYIYIYIDIYIYNSYIIYIYREREIETYNVILCIWYIYIYIYIYISYIYNILNLYIYYIKYMYTYIYI